MVVITISKFFMQAFETGRSTEESFVTPSFFGLEVCCPAVYLSAIQERPQHGLAVPIYVLFRTRAFEQLRLNWREIV